MNKKQVKTKEDLELYYNKCRKIKFAVGREEPTSTKQVIQRVLDYEGDSERTVFTRGGHNCLADKLRSLDDVVKIVKYYYPKKKIKDIIGDILKYQKTFNFDFYFGYCPNIRKTNLVSDQGTNITSVHLCSTFVIHASTLSHIKRLGVDVLYQ